MKRISVRGLVTVILVAAAAGCGGGDGGGSKHSDMPRVEPPVNENKVRDFTVAEAETLRSLRMRNHVTRDEYWDDRGGVLGNDVVEVWYPPGKLTVSHGMYALDFFMRTRREVQRMFGRVPEEQLTIILTQTMEAYTDFTGRQWWNYSQIKDDRIVYQPVTVLLSRGLLNLALPREMYEWEIGRLAGDDAPRWLIEGLASRLVDEESILEDNLGEFTGVPVKMQLDDVEKALEADDNKRDARIAYYNACMMVKRLDHKYGRQKLADMVNALGGGSSLDSASKAAFGLPYDELIAYARGWVPPGERKQ